MTAPSSDTALWHDQIRTNGSLHIPALSQAERAAFAALDERLSGEVRFDDVHRFLYATDASIYECIPRAVTLPRNTEDLLTIVAVAGELGLPLTPRTAGTSLSGQTVGAGIIVDTGRFMTSTWDLDEEARTVWVEPGVIRDDLNRWLKPKGLLFGPDTSTSNRCMVGGMVGNNSCGSHSVFYGTTRDHLEAIDVVFVDGTQARLGVTTREEWARLRELDNALGEGVRTLERIVSEHRDEILAAYPKPSVIRRNTGYPLDLLADSWLGGVGDKDPNLAQFFCGTEGTLALTTAAKLTLDPVPGAEILIAVHFEDLDASLRATVEAVRMKPSAVELMDKRILDLSRLNAEQEKNRWFVQGDPGAILVIQFYGDDQADAERKATALVEKFKQEGLGYAYPVIAGAKMNSVWELRKAGLGVLMGSPGDVKPVTLVEDTAVAVEDLPAYIREFARVMAEYDAQCVYYAHASVGELHLRPELDLKKKEDVERALGIARDVAILVNKYRGSLSGEHGDGRLRSPYIREALGERVVGWLEEVKLAFDPGTRLNPKVIVDPEPMVENWRYHEDYRNVDWNSEFAYESSFGFQRAVERCNGAGVCRRPAEAGGTMCPSYMVTKEERESTRGRANLFRRLIQTGPESLYRSEELKDALDLCISCKGCKSDCPASVDMATLKAEFQQGWHDRHGTPLSAKMFAAVTELTRIPQKIPGAMAVANWGQSLSITKHLFKRLLNVHPNRNLPEFASRSFHAQFEKRGGSKVHDQLGEVLLFVDEFTDRYEPEIGMAAVELLEAGGYTVRAPKLGPSGRTYLSKGLVRKARECIEENIATLYEQVDEVDAIVGVEPSGVLTMIDEALDLPQDTEIRGKAASVAAKVLLVPDFVAQASRDGRWNGEWKEESRSILLHGHCHQKALVGLEATVEALKLPPNYSVETIPSGCCGMAGSFGYEADHYEISMDIGELVLFPAVRKADESRIIAAPGTSCRHQIADGTKRQAKHPIEILRDAVKVRALRSS